MAVRLSVMYTHCATSLREQTGDTITFTIFEEGGLLSKSCNSMESGDKSDDSDDYYNLPQIISESRMDKMLSGDEYYSEPIPTYMLEYISGRSQSRLSLNRTEARYKICNSIKQRQAQ